MKELIKGLVPPLASMVPGALAQRILGDFCPIFMLHRISTREAASEQSACHIESCLRLVRRYGFTPISLQALAEAWLLDTALPPKPVVFTIDDGFADHAEIAGHLFARYDTPLTCFVITGFLDGELWPWDDQIAWALRMATPRSFRLTLPYGQPWEVCLSPDSVDREVHRLREALKGLAQDGLYEWLPSFYRALAVEVPAAPPPEYRPMTWPQARAFVRQGHTIAPHTHSHRILSCLSASNASREIDTSISRVRAELGQTPQVFAYPTGRDSDYGPREQQLLRDAGLMCAVSTAPRTATPAENAFSMPRFSLPNTAVDFLQYLSFVELAKERFRRAIRSGQRYRHRHHGKQ
jgi:peptidoglycan/xylan/chitin deacetylase (PgdA/CDA1 family)